MDTSTSRHTTGRLLLVIVAALVLAELGARALETSRRTSAPEQPPFVPFSMREARETDGSVAFAIDGGASTVADPLLLWRNRPSIDLSRPVAPVPAAGPRNWRLATDERGMRRNDLPPIEGKPDYRILFVGDSVMQGYQVDQGKDAPTVLARRLRTRYPKLHLEVINAGTPEWSWVQGDAFLVREGLALAPDLVVIAHGTADQIEQATVTDSERLWLLARAQSRKDRLSELLRTSALWRLVFPEEPPSDTAPSPGCRLQIAAGSSCRRVALPEIAATVRHIGQSARAAGVDLLLVNLDFSMSRAAAAVRETAAREKLRYLDEVGALRLRDIKDQMKAAHARGVALPRVPLVPFAAIGPAIPQDRGPRILFRVLAPAGSGDLSVRGHASDGSGFVFEQPLRDDGAGGDEKAGDGIWSATVESLPSVDSLSYRYWRAGTPEFDAPPGMQDANVDRVVRFNRDATAMIETFGSRRWMSDELHPDEQGQAEIAMAVIAELERIPSFRRAANLPALPPTNAAPGPAQPPAASPAPKKR